VLHTLATEQAALESALANALELVATASELFLAVMNRSLTIHSGQTPVHRYLRPLLERIERGDIDPTFVVTHRLGLDDAPIAYEDVQAQEGRVREGRPEAVGLTDIRAGALRPTGADPDDAKVSDGDGFEVASGCRSRVNEGNP
jgi:hypothetical protein